MIESYLVNRKKLLKVYFFLQKIIRQAILCTNQLSNFNKIIISVDQTSDEPAIEDLLKNCQKYKDELRMGEILKGAVEEYKTLLKKAKETGCKVNSVAAARLKQVMFQYLDDLVQQKYQVL